MRLDDPRIYIIAFMCVSSCGLIVLFWWKPPSPDNQLLNTVVGAYISTGFVMALQWLFGSSKGSEDKNAPLIAAATKSAEPATSPSPAISPARIAAGAVVVLLAMMWAMPVLAQSDPNVRQPASARGPIATAIANRAAENNDPLQSLAEKIDNAALPDLKYGKALCDADGGPTCKLVSICYGAWIERIEKRQAANAGAEPDPHLFTAVAKVVALHDSLQASSPFMIACSPLASALRQNVTQLIGAVMGGGAGIARLLPGLP